MKQLILIAGVILGINAWADETQDVAVGRCAHTTDSFNCVKFIKNYDGDTLTVNIPSVHPLIGQKITVRVEGIDAPEMETTDACERKAAIRAQHEAEKFLATANRIDLKQTKRDKYFRVLADVKADGKSLAQHLLDEGLAVAYDGGHKDTVDWCGH